MSSLSGIALADQWLDQFEDTDREIARLLLEEVHLVSANAFSDGIVKLIDQVIAERSDPDRKIALYAEQPVKPVFGTIPAFFPGSRHGRAEGPGVQPVKADPRDQEIGSEGVIAQLITAYCRQNPAVALSHPGPSKLRKDRVNHIVIVTDLIGSGDRIYNMLEALRYVATLRSWHSYKLIKFVVIAYAATDTGISRLRFSPLPHTVRSVLSCPTISSAFRGARRKLVENLCWRYPPKRRGDPFGWRSGGALIAFSHGCPNNAPALLWSRANSWLPIFGGRATLGASEAFRADEAELLRLRAERLLRIQEARSRLDTPNGKLWLTAMAVLAAAEEGARGEMQTSARLGVAIDQVRENVALCRNSGWLDEAGKLTLLGRMELKRLRRRFRRKPIFPSDDNPFYYPSQLRAP